MEFFYKFLVWHKRYHGNSSSSVMEVTLLCYPPPVLWRTEHDPGSQAHEVSVPLINGPLWYLHDLLELGSSMFGVFGWGMPLRSDLCLSLLTVPFHSHVASFSHHINKPPLLIRRTSMDPYCKITTHQATLHGLFPPETLPQVRLWHQGFFLLPEPPSQSVLLDSPPISCFQSLFPTAPLVFLVWKPPIDWTGETTSFTHPPPLYPLPLSHSMDLS